MSLGHESLFSVLFGGSGLISSHLLVSFSDRLVANLLLQDRVNHCVSQGYGAFHPQIVVVAVLVAVVDFKLLPDPPERTLVLLRIAVLTQVRVDASRPLDLVQLPFELGEPQSQLNQQLVRLEPLECSLVHLSCP